MRRSNPRSYTVKRSRNRAGACQSRVADPAFLVAVSHRSLRHDVRNHLAIVLATAAVTFTSAQTQPSSRRMTGRPFLKSLPSSAQGPNLSPKSLLLGFEGVQVELKMTDAQKKKLEGIRFETREEVEQKLQEASKEHERREIEGIERSARRNRRKEVEQRFLAELTADQREPGPDSASSTKRDGL